MPVARKDVRDLLNEHALECAQGLINIGLGKDKGEDAHIRMGALKAVLAKVVPDLRAVEAKVEGNLTVDKITLGGE